MVVVVVSGITRTPRTVAVPTVRLTRASSVATWAISEGRRGCRETGRSWRSGKRGLFGTFVGPLSLGSVFRVARVVEVIDTLPAPVAIVPVIALSVSVPLTVPMAMATVRPVSVAATTVPVPLPTPVTVPVAVVVPVPVRAFSRSISSLAATASPAFFVVDVVAVPVAPFSVALPIAVPRARAMRTTSAMCLCRMVAGPANQGSSVMSGTQ
ncbi:hypothetical protein C8Q77DRAFT_65710 [Trametes polyzona]|nr:hypothetical protein C8Q77DRAFT_65710 [Trametes polyzona]